MTEARAKTPSPLLAKLIVGIHTFIFRASNGRLGKTMGGAPVVLLTVRGRKSGRLIHLPLVYIRTERGWAVVASKGGAPSHPAWFLNLQAAGEAQIQIGGEKTHVRTRILMPDDADYAKIWADGVKMFPGYLDYKKATSREFPIVEFLPVA